MSDSPRLTVLHVAAPAQFGGLESVVLDLCAGLAGAGHRVVLCVILGAPAGAQSLPVRASALGIDVRQIMVPHRAYLREYKAIGRLIAELRPDVVHTHGYHADLIGGLAARSARIPWVATSHGFIGGGRRNRFYEWLQVRTLRRAAAVIAVSRPMQDRLKREGVPVNRIKLLLNAWTPKPLLSRDEARRRLGLPDGEPVIGWVGRLTSEKGADVFLEALALLANLRWFASIVGDGADRPVLEAQARRLGIGNRLRWHGILPEAAALYSAFDAWVLSSRSEGTPIALFEAMGAGAHIVATTVGGVPDVIGPEEALMVPTERPDAMAGALREVLADPAQAALRARAARRRLEEAFAPQPWIDEHLSLYAALSPTRVTTAK